PRFRRHECGRPDQRPSLLSSVGLIAETNLCSRQSACLYSGGCRRQSWRIPRTNYILYRMFPVRRTKYFHYVFVKENETLAMFEILHCALVSFGCLSGAERTQVAPSPRLGVFLSRVQSVLPGL